MLLQMKFCAYGLAVLTFVVNTKSFFVIRGDNTNYKCPETYFAYDTADFEILSEDDDPMVKKAFEEMFPILISKTNGKNMTLILTVAETSISYPTYTQLVMFLSSDGKLGECCYRYNAEFWNDNEFSRPYCKIAPEKDPETTIYKYFLLHFKEYHYHK
ncbi:uncharacterized protein LOC142318356 isoform X1 [Lycorma delicatula]|uniref:uncharacterized protein LOC142318356 isoform X1 n=1 Tax=Lycorma delicatula TaxID=130591 RepID=UPI003F515905